MERVNTTGSTRPGIEDDLLQECELCHDYFDLQQIRWNGRQMLCDKCGGVNKAESYNDLV